MTKNDYKIKFKVFTNTKLEFINEKKGLQLWIIIKIE
jgi:hypothetical protein